MVRPRTFLDFSVNNEPLGRVIFELYNDTAPKTSENFRALCTGERGVSPVSQQPLYYKNSTIHRSIKDFMIQGGDFTKFNGTGGESIYGGSFADEDLSRPLDSEALLCMANKGLNTNNSQFFITLRECPHLNGKHVVFGRVIRGYEIVRKIATLPVDAKSRPLTPIIVSNCGELELRKPPAKPVEPFPSERATSEKRRNRRSRSSSESHSRSESRSRSRERERRQRKKKKSKRRRSPEDATPSPQDLKSVTKVPTEETEEEYDARLEREEKERLEDARQRELARIKEKYAAELRSSTGVRFKGRGRMKFVDPELTQRSHESR